MILTKGYVPIVGQGKARWTNVHVADLSHVYLLLAERATQHDNNPELWGEKGYLFTENGEHVWSDLARQIGREATTLGYITEPKEGSLGKDEALEQAGFEAVSWGLNSRAKAQRARKFLQWEPKQHSLEEEVPEILRQERQRLEK